MADLSELRNEVDKELEVLSSEISRMKERFHKQIEDVERSMILAELGKLNSRLTAIEVRLPDPEEE